MSTEWIVRFGLWIAGLGGWEPPVCTRAHECALPHECVRPHADIPSGLLASASMLIDQVETNFPSTSGELKRREVIRALMNRHPDLKPRALSMALEVAFHDHA